VLPLTVGKEEEKNRLGWLRKNKTLSSFGCSDCEKANFEIRDGEFCCGEIFFRATAALWLTR